MRLIPNRMRKNGSVEAQPEEPAIASTDLPVAGGDAGGESGVGPEATPESGTDDTSHGGGPEEQPETPETAMLEAEGRLDESKAELGQQPEGRSERRPPRRPAKQALRGAQVSLSVEQDNVRVVAFKGRQIIAWGTASLAQDISYEQAGEHGLNGAALVAAPLARFELLRDFLRHMGVGDGSAVLSDLPAHDPLTRYLRVQKGKSSYFQQMVLAEILETVPFSQDEVDFAWQYRSMEQDREVRAVVLSRAAVDKHARLLREAGLRPRGFYSKGIALTHLAGATDAIIAFADAAHATIVLVRDGGPRYVNQTPLSADSEEDPSERAARIAEAVQEVVESHATEEPGTAAPAFPVLLTGQAATDASLVEALRMELPHEVGLCSPRGVVYPPSFPIEEYSINLGLILASRAKGKKWAKDSPLVPPLDLLPERHLPRPLPVRLVAAYTGLLLLGGAAVLANGPVEAVTAEAAALSAEQQAVERQVRADRLVVTAATALEQDIQATEHLTGILAARLADTEEKLGILLERFETITHRAMSDEVALTRVSEQGDRFAISGTARTYEDALAYTANLRESGLFEQVRLLEVSASGGPPESPEGDEGPADPSMAEPGAGDPEGGESEAAPEQPGEPGADPENAGVSDPEAAPPDAVAMSITARIAPQETSTP